MATLDSLPIGATARITAIEGSDPIVQRLYEMGLLEGEDIEVIGAAPLGDPIEIRVRGYYLSLRRSEARRVQVDAIATPPVDNGSSLDPSIPKQP